MDKFLKGKNGGNIATVADSMEDIAIVAAFLCIGLWYIVSLQVVNFSCAISRVEDVSSRVSWIPTDVISQM